MRTAIIITITMLAGGCYFNARGIASETSGESSTTSPCWDCDPYPDARERLTDASHGGGSEGPDPDLGTSTGDEIGTTAGLDPESASTSSSTTSSGSFGTSTTGGTSGTSTGEEAGSTTTGGESYPKPSPPYGPCYENSWADCDQALSDACSGGEHAYCLSSCGGGEYGMQGSCPDAPPGFEGQEVCAQPSGNGYFCALACETDADCPKWQVCKLHQPGPGYPDKLLCH
jgi:hypothetical protein